MNQVLFVSSWFLQETPGFLIGGVVLAGDVLAGVYRRGGMYWRGYMGGGVLAGDGLAAYLNYWIFLLLSKHFLSYD